MNRLIKQLLIIVCIKNFNFKALSKMISYFKSFIFIFGYIHFQMLILIIKKIGVIDKKEAVFDHFFMLRNIFNSRELLPSSNG